MRERWGPILWMCSLKNKCSTRASCVYSSRPNNWLRNRPCISIVDLFPTGSQPVMDPLETVTLTFQLLPQLSVNETYGCRFDELPVTYGITDGQSIQCRAPAKADIPVIPPQEDHVAMLLGVFSSESMVTFISTTFSYFDCTRHMTCGACVLSDWNCDWCVFDNACTHQSSICTHGDTIVTGNNNPVSSPRQGLDFCPQIRPQTTQILIPVGTSKDFVVNVRSLPDPTKVTGYQCSLLVEGTTQITQATLVTDDVIRCHGRMYSYEADDKRELIVPLRVHWNGDMQLERNNNTVTLYKCDVDRPDCSRCLSVETARPELGCRWCGTKCAFMEDTECPSSSLSPGSQCPAPVLKHVFPASGPVEGNTVIEINGSDIGQSIQDIQRVMIGNQLCNLTGWYVTGQSVRCITSPLSSSIAQTVTVSVARTAGGEDLISTGAVQFTYKNPAITGISPIEGYADGGTILTITGTDLDIGRDIQVNVAANVTCDITSVTCTAIRCRLGMSTEGHAGRVEVTFDGTPRSSADIFTFVPLPDILRFDPQSSIQSGGRVLTVYGRRFTVVSSATIKVQYKNDTFKQSCHVESAETMICTTPAIADIVPITNCIHATLGLDVDGKQLFIPSPGFTYCQNPIVQRFDGDELLVDSANISSLTMKVEMTSWAIADSEITVTLGGEAECQFVTLTPDVLTCRLPYNEPPDQAVATVRWYGNGSFRLGKVVYTNVGLTAEVFALIAAIVGVMLLIISVLATIKYCRQKRRLKRVTQEYNERLLARIRGLHEDILEAAEVRRIRKLAGTKANIRAKAKNSLPPKSIVLNEHVNIVPGDLHIKFSQLDMGGILGQGAFGRVFQAVLNNAQIGTGQTVAVKTVQDTTDSTNVIKFLQEGLLMKNFDHPNVLGLIGLTFNPDGQPVVVLPFMPNGDLKSYVVKNKQELTHNQLLKFASHVAHGMEYLGRAKFVHRDLAARNCMVDDKLVVKIADFGLSRDLSEADYYTSGDKHAKLPIKWMAPESMERRVYNAKTDVWSYGVLLWELFSGGSSPYPGIRNRDIYDFLKRGERMDPPRFCHIKISEIMQKCWRDSPKSRCSFREIVGEFDQLLTTITPGDAPPLPATPRGLDGQGERYTDHGKGSIMPMDVIENKGGGKRERENVVGNKEIGECGESGNGDGGGYLIPTGNTRETWKECVGVDRKGEVTSPRVNSSLNENRGNWDECNESGIANRGSYLIPTGNALEAWGECMGVGRKVEVTSPRENSSLNENRGTCDECTGSEYRNSYLIPMMEEKGQGNYGDHCGGDAIPMESLNGKTGNSK
ncbi:hepatocyte growth factor receptor-like [Asterias rubens]|uniref:hepatocyte growth factor receptor-like n=1 Tax=Asterias rubens TaxID=7604 RepID=UPI0014552FFA|nr:hepatocyte growth factor receptor-like [Asterias rubens]